jgi:hypothetical protein
LEEYEMGSRARQSGMDSRNCRCDVCGGDIIIDFYFEQGDVVSCDECSSEYIIQRRSPMKLMLFEESSDGFFYDELDFN